MATPYTVPANPLGAPEPAPQDYNAYAAPSLESGYPTNKVPGWSPTLRVGYDTEPDATRLGTLPTYDFRPKANRPPEEFWAGTNDIDERRHDAGVRNVNTGWTEGKGLPPRFAPNPRSLIIPESRPTMALSPNTYSFFRLFDQYNRTYHGDPPTGSARDLNGVHFSMADHRRNYDIMGMHPQRKPGAGTRNTYRLDPGPWDENIVDMPPNASPLSADVTPAYGIDVPPPSPSYRLS